MKKKRFFALVLFFSAVAFPPNAYAITGNELLPKCQRFLSSVRPVAGLQFQYDGSADSAKCYGFAQAILSLAYLYLVDYETRIPETQSVLRVCPPQGVGTVQLIRMFVKYANDNPGRLNDDAVFLMMSTLKQNYSCDKK